MIRRILLSCLAGLGFLAGQTAFAQTTRVDVGAFSGANAWPVLVAQSKGYFKARGLDVRVREVEDYAEMVALNRENRVHLNIVAYDNLLAIKPGMPKLIGIANFAEGGLVLMAAPKFVKDLKGARVGVDDPDSGFAILAYDLMAKRGMPRGSYPEISVGGTFERFRALDNGAIDAAIIHAPFDAMLKADDFVEVDRVETRVGPYQTGVVAAAEPWLKNNRQTARRFLEAQCEALVFMKNPANREEVARILDRDSWFIGRRMARQFYDSLVIGENSISGSMVLNRSALQGTHDVRARVTGIQPISVDEVNDFTLAQGLTCAGAHS